MSTELSPVPAPSKDDRLLAAVAHGLTFVEGGILGPLVLYFAKKDESEFIAFHALQSVYFGLLMVSLIVLGTFLLCGAGMVLVIPYLVFEVVAALKAHDGEWYKLPIVGDLAYARHHP